MEYSSKPSSLNYLNDVTLTVEILPKSTHDLECGDQNKVDQEIDGKFQCYACVIYTYLVIIALEAFGNLLSFVAHPNLKTAFALAITVAMLLSWIVGRQAKNKKDISTQIKFQGLLILFVIYHVVMIGTIIAESYSTIPYLTFTAFALNIIYGVMIPLVMYSTGDDLRKLMEKRAKIIC